MPRRIIALIAFMLFSSAALAADCRPPPNGLSFDQWANLCTNEIDYAYQLYGGGMDYDAFMQSLYGMYLNPPSQTPAACSPEGATQCNSSGWLYTCTNGQWLTGSVKCGG